MARPDCPPPTITVSTRSTPPMAHLPLLLHGRTAPERDGTARPARPRRANDPDPGGGGGWAILCRRLHQAVLVGVGGGRRPGGQAQLGVDVAEVARHRLLAQDQVGGDRAVGLAGRDQAEHLDVAGGRPAGRPGGRPAGQRLHPRQLRDGAELLEHPAGRVQLHLRAVVVPQPPAGQPEQDPDPRPLVRHVQRLPGRPGAAQRGQGSPHVALGEQDRAARVGGQRVQQRLADLGRPAEGRACGRGVALEQALVPDQDQQVSLLGAVALASRSAAARRA
jgi:hypothetical protein